jgi:hypothetical protein
VVWKGACGVDELVIARNPQGESGFEREAEKEVLALSIYITPEEAEKIAEMIGQ